MFAGLSPAGFGGGVGRFGVFAPFGLVWLAGGRTYGIVVSVRPGWARNYFTYFSVYSARHVVTCLRAGSDSPGDTSGANAVSELGL